VTGPGESNDLIRAITEDFASRFVPRSFAEAQAGIVYVTAFPTRAAIARYLADIAWHTTVWVADEPSHLIHFNGGLLLTPYGTK